MIAKSTAIKDRGGKSGGRAGKAVDLTSGGLRRVRATGLSANHLLVVVSGKPAKVVPLPSENGVTKRPGDLVAQGADRIHHAR
jgi:hypothetical protein